LEEPEWATDSAGWYWTTGSSRNLNDLADKNDLLAITALVNGAFNGFEDRRKHLEAAISVLKVSGCKTSGIGNEKFRPFKDSDIYNKMILSFAWGCWNDPNSGKSGVDKSVEQRKLGYQRFLDLYNALTPAQQHHLKSRYGFNPKKMISLATEGVQ
jgi:putative chitinase